MINPDSYYDNLPDDEEDSWVTELFDAGMEGLCYIMIGGSKPTLGKKFANAVGKALTKDWFKKDSESDDSDMPDPKSFIEAEDPNRMEAEMRASDEDFDDDDQDSDIEGFDDDLE